MAFVCDNIGFKLIAPFMQNLFGLYKMNTKKCCKNNNRKKLNVLSFCEGFFLAFCSSFAEIDLV